jgi:transposase
VTKRPCRTRTHRTAIQQEKTIMTEPIAGIDPHQRTFTVGIVDPLGVETHIETFDNSGAGYTALIDLLTAHGVQLVGIEGSGSWGVHVAVALVAGGFDAREVPPSRTATQRRARRLDKTDAVDAVSTARALQAEPHLGPVQALDAYDPLVAKIEAVLEHRQALVAARTLLLHQVGDQLTKLPPEIRDQLEPIGKVESRLRRLMSIDIPESTTPAGDYRLSWLLDFIDRDRAARREVRRLERLIDELLDQHGTSLREEPGIGPIAAATLLCEVGDPTRFATESKFARWSGTGAVALSSGEGNGQPTRHRVDFRGNRTVNSVLYIASITQARDRPDARAYLARKTAEGKTAREARRAHKRHLANRVIRRMWKDEQARRRRLQPAA